MGKVFKAWVLRLKKYVTIKYLQHFIIVANRPPLMQNDTIEPLFQIRVHEEPTAVSGTAQHYNQEQDVWKTKELLEVSD